MARAVDTFVYPSLVDETNALYSPSDHHESYDRFRDIKAILKTALDKTQSEYGPYILREDNVPMTEARYLEELRNGRTINVAWSSTSEKKEKDFLPVRVDLRKGLLSYRICIINKDSQRRLRSIKNLDQFRQLTIGQGIGWGDVDIYRFNGVHTETAAYGNLFLMVEQKRIDAFPRGVTEVFGEYAAASQQLKDLAIDDSLLIYYPAFPYYFFLNKKDTRLAERLETGLHIMMADGSFDRIFWKFNRSLVKRARLSTRTIIRLDNPLIKVPLQTSP